jgi:hypothetical protein
MSKTGIVSGLPAVPKIKKYLYYQYNKYWQEKSCGITRVNGRAGNTGRCQSGFFTVD